MDLVNLFKSFLVSIFTTISQLFSADASVDHEATVVEQHHLILASPVDNQHKLDWALKMIGLCLPIAEAIALQSLETRSQLPLVFQFLSLAVIFSFNFLFLSKFITPKFPQIAQVFERVGIFLAVTAIYIAITISLPISLKCIAWTIFVISFVAIIVCHRHV